jgi:tetratricopeptide (TPR) repeat protein
MMRTTTFLLAAWLAAAGAVLADEAGARARAIALYDAADYAAALPLLEQVAASGDADGPLLYRLAFARSQSGDRAGAAEAQARALATLEQEYADGGDLETAFYLSNAYRNMRRPEDSRRVAAETTARIEAGQVPVPDDPLDAFRAGKLYEDQGLFEQVVPWYERAVAGMSSSPENHLGYLRWALRMLGNIAYSDGDHATSEARFARLTELDPTSATDWDALASARARLGRWAPAEQAWMEVEKIQPADANRARYCYRLARLAAEIGELPSELPDGRALDTLTKEELEAVLTEQADKVRAVRSEIPEGSSLTDEGRAELQDRLDRARPVFVAAAMEYALRRLPIRETAFFGGYAPLIFKREEWNVPD